MELYKRYLAERDGVSVYYNDYGFITFSIKPDGDCYFSEIYVVPEKRNSRVAFSFWKHVLMAAAIFNCTHITGSVDVTTSNWQLSEKLMLKLGFVVELVNGNMKYFRKNL